MIRPIMYMEMQLLHTICIIYYKERFSNRKGCISIYNLRLRYGFYLGWAIRYLSETSIENAEHSQTKEYHARTIGC